MGDIDGDGTVDLLITSAWSGIDGYHSGRVFLISSGIAKNAALKERFEITPEGIGEMAVVAEAEIDGDATERIRRLQDALQTVTDAQLPEASGERLNRVCSEAPGTDDRAKCPLDRLSVRGPNADRVGSQEALHIVDQASLPEIRWSGKGSPITRSRRSNTVSSMAIDSWRSPAVTASKRRRWSR